MAIHINLYFTYSPQVARRISLSQEIPWKQVNRWEQDIRNEYNDSFVPELDNNVHNAFPLW